MAFTPSAGTYFERDLRSWVGDDLRVAMLAGGPLFVACVRDEHAAKAVLKRLGASSGRHVQGRRAADRAPSGTAAFTEDHLVVGAVADVRGAIDRAAGKGTPSLAESRVFRRADEQRAGAPSVDVFASAAGLRRLLGAGSPPASWPARAWRACAAAARKRTACGSPAASCARPAPGPTTAFAPSMAARAPKAAAAFLELPGLDAVGRPARRPGGAAQLEALRDALPQAAGIELDDLLDPLSRDARMTVTPSTTARSSRSTPGPATPPNA